jgi:hypothetical protein
VDCCLLAGAGTGEQGEPAASATMSFLVSSIYSIFSRYTPFDDREPSNSSVALNPADFDFLAQQHDGGEEGDSSLLQDEKILLAECKSSLEGYYRRERFVGVRIERYRELLDQRQKDIMIRIDSADNDVENKRLDSLNVLQTKLYADELSLQSVVELHKDIIAQMEALRRRIDNIEFKVDDIDTKRIECQEMLIAVDQNNRLSWESVEGGEI